jgi:hypothetical protein
VHPNRSLRRRAVGGVLLAAAALTLSAPRALACSICRCGDPTFNALGTNVYSSGQFHLALDWDRFSKSQRTVEDGRTGTDSEIENRYTATLSYSVGERFLFVARVPFSDRDLTTTFPDETSTVVTDGLSDPEFYGLVRLWSSSFGPGLGRRTWISAVFGVKTPWGRNDIRADGARVDEHAQSGTGSTDFFGGLSGLYLFDADSALFASAQYRGTGRNDFGYKYGGITMANLAYERKLSEVFDGVLEVDFRHAGRDQVAFDGERDPDTGGSILYVTPRILVNLGKGIVLRMSVQIPAVQKVYGVQDEKVNYNAGLTFLF